MAWQPRASPWAGLSSPFRAKCNAPFVTNHINSVPVIFAARPRNLPPQGNAPTEHSYLLKANRGVAGTEALVAATVRLTDRHLKRKTSESMTPKGRTEIPSPVAGLATRFLATTCQNPCFIRVHPWLIILQAKQHGLESVAATVRLTDRHLLSNATLARPWLKAVPPL